MTNALSASLPLAHISSFQRPFGPRVLHDEAAVSAPSTVIREAPSGTSDNMSALAAADMLAKSRRKKQTEAAPVVEAPAHDESAADGADDQATAALELSDEGDAAPVETQATGETEGTQNPSADAPKPIPLPKSWKKEQADTWSALPRSTQEFLSEQASKTSAEVRRLQNETADKTKALTAKEQAAEEQRTQYEGKLKSVVEIMEREQLRDFPEIRSQADLDKMVNDAVQLSAKAEGLWETDPLQAGATQAKVQQIQSKLAAWDIHQRKLVAATNELKSADDRKSKVKTETWNTHVQEQNKLAAEKIPELADKVKGPALRTAAIESLLELGFTHDELNKMGSGEERISIADHRLQLLIRSHLRLAEIQKAPKALPKAPLPPVQRPGTPQPRTNAVSETVKTLTNTLNRTGSLKDAVALRMAQQRATRR